MNVKKAIKKVVALGVGVSMLGATLIGATASPYDLSEYPAPYIQDGMFNGLMVVGDDAAPADIIGVTDIAMSLQYSSTVKETIKVSGEAGVMLGGDSVKIQRSGDVLELNELLGDVTETLDSADAEALKSFTVSNDKGTTDVNQYLRFAWDDPTIGTKAAAKVLYTEDDDDNVGDFLWFDDGEEVFKYELEFVEGFESDVNTVDWSLDDLEDETLHILGEDFAVVSAKLSNSGATLTMNLMGGAIHDTIEEGETKTYTLKGKEYEVTALIISDWAGAAGNAKVKLKVNGEVTKEMQEGSTEILNDGTTIGIREVLPNEAGETAGGDILEFYLGAFKIQLTDATGAATASYDGTVKVNEENIEDSDLSMAFTNTANETVRVSKISYILFTDGVGGDEPYASPGQGLREKLDEPEGMLADTWDIRYEGLSDPGSSELKVKASGDDEYRLSFTNTQGIDYSNVRLFYTNSSCTTAGDVYYGDEDDAFVFAMNYTVGDGTKYTICRNDYFVVGHNTHLDTGVSRILRFDSVDTSNDLVQLTDIGTGAAVNSQYTASCDLGTAGNCVGQINIGGYTFDFAVANSTAATGCADYGIAVDLNDSNAAGLAETGLVIKGGGIVDLGTQTTYRAIVVDADNDLNLTTKAKNFDEATTDEVITINITSASGEVDLSVVQSASLNLFTPEDNDNLKVGMSNYGILVKEQDEDNDPDSVTITYPLAQVLPQVFVTFEKTVTMEGGAGTITVERPQRIEIGSAVLASQVSDPTAANVVTVGGPCINSVTAEIMGLTYPACGADSGLGEGEGIVKLYESGEKVAIVVAGWEAEDTTRATRVLADYKTYQEAGKLVGTEVKVAGTSATEFTVTPVSEE
ncbi:hypothetical protein JW898_03060 [Candidatus Woesearchaeota archaeon]|nr:hypothetical protein [Candidatus Woesearchaeota archaeon]